MQVRFWGTRGSIPTPSTEAHKTVRYGGNTSCVEVMASAGRRLIFDGGTGLRNLGLSLRGVVGHYKVLFSHVHWDHIQGFPFFPPLFDPRNAVTCYGPQWPSDGDGQATIEMALLGQQTAPHFPARLENYPAKVRIEGVRPGSHFEVDGLRLRTASLNHPNGSLAYRVDDPDSGQSMVYATDNEHPKEGLSATLQGLIGGADILIYDAQYTPELYHGTADGICRHGWGHSTPFHGVDEALAAGVKTLILFHHDPSHDDARLDEVLNQARDYATSRSDRALRIEAAQEGVIIEA